MASSSIQHQQLQQQQQQGLPSNKHAVLMSASIAFNFSHRHAGPFKPTAELRN